MKDASFQLLLGISLGFLLSRSVRGFSTWGWESWAVVLVGTLLVLVVWKVDNSTEV